MDLVEKSRKGRDFELECQYSLKLVDGSVWVLSADHGAGGRLKELAAIMELQPAEHIPGTRRLCLTCTEDLTGEQLPRVLQGQFENGWQMYRNGSISMVWRHDGIPAVHIELNEAFLNHAESKYINRWTALREIQRGTLQKGGTPMHAALAALNGRGVLIAAAGETGKSTCCRRLPASWEVLCDDQVLVVPKTHTTFYVHPLPTWSEHLWHESAKSRQVGRSVPLTAVFFLEQSARDGVIPISDPTQKMLVVFEAAKQIWKPYWERLPKPEKTRQTTLLFHNTSHLASAIPCFQLQATLEGKFWKEMEAVLNEARKPEKPIPVPLPHLPQ